MTSEPQRVLRLPERYFRGYPTDDSMIGQVEAPLELDLARTAFVSFHCWNIGFPDGPDVPPAYWVFMGSQENHRLCNDVTNNRIAPALNAARSAGMTVFHVQTPNIADKYPGWDYLLDSAPEPTAKQAAIDGYPQYRAERTHGEGFREWEGWKAADITGAVGPEPGEQIVVDGAQFDRILRERGIVNLIYAGFATNLCILDSPAAMKEMNAFGYRCLLIRECTLAVEFAETIADLTNTNVALRYIEAWVGSTVSLDDYSSALQELTRKPREESATAEFSRAPTPESIPRDLS